MQKIFRPDYVEWFEYDEEDGEDIEIRKIVGFFLDYSFVQKAIESCVNKGKISRENLIMEFDIEIFSRQKYVYYLINKYSIIDEQGEYVDYTYYFPPHSNETKCKEEKQSILLQKEYEKSTKKIHPDVYGKDDGFYICTPKINKISSEFCYD